MCYKTSVGNNNKKALPNRKRVQARFIELPIPSMFGREEIQMNTSVTVESQSCAPTKPGNSLVLLSFLLVTLLPQAGNSQEQFRYTAQLHETSIKLGTVVASGIRWNCQGSQCTVTGPWPVPGTSACMTLAEQVGRISRYGHSKARLNAKDLERCNKAAAERTAVLGGISSGSVIDSLPSEPTVTLENPYPGLLRTSSETWRCSGNTCTYQSSRGDIGARQAVGYCSRVAQVAGRVLFFTNGRLPLSAEDLERCNSPVVHELEVIACSGDDDLRRNSQLRMGMRFRNGNFTLDSYRTIFTEIPANACKTRRLSGVGWLPFLRFNLGNLMSLHFRFLSFDSGPFDTADNWDMVQFTINATVTAPGGRRYVERIVDLRDNPIVRFSDKDFWTKEINP